MSDRKFEILVFALVALVIAGMIGGVAYVEWDRYRHFQNQRQEKVDGRIQDLEAAMFGEDGC